MTTTTGERKKQPTKQRAQHKLFIDVFKRFVELRSTLAIFLIEHIHIVRALCSRRRGREKKLIRFEILSSLFSFHLVVCVVLVFLFPVTAIIQLFFFLCCSLVADVVVVVGSHFVWCADFSMHTKLKNP